MIMKMGTVRLMLSLELEVKQKLMEICEARKISASDFMREKIKDEYKSIQRDRRHQSDDRGELARNP